MVEKKFLKMHGCGNDFIVFHDPDDRFNWNELAELARRYCPRRFGVGADGVIAVGAPGEADYEMRYVNADGSVAEMCGNGIRCVGKFVAEELGEARDEVQVLTGAGILPIELHRQGGAVNSVTVGMGVPGIRAAEVPTTLRSSAEQVIDVIMDLNGYRLALTAVSIGNPHVVCFEDELTDEHVLGLGPEISSHAVFPNKANVEFVQMLGPERLRMRVWERGVGETLACGTGACAAVVAATLNGRIEHGRDTCVVLNGGELMINWAAIDQQVYMTGPATTVYQGILTV